MRLKRRKGSPSVSAFDFGLPRFLSPFVRWVLRLKQLEAVYDASRRNLNAGAQAGEFFERVLSTLGVKVELALDDIERLRLLPGPLLLVANHPFGGVDALVLISMLQKIRSEFKFFGNSSLQILPELKSVLLPVNVMERSRHSHSNVSVLRSAMDHLISGGALGIFPAGQVAELPGWSSSLAEERPWTHHVGILAKNTRSTVIPIYFHGQAGKLFLRMGYLFPPLRLPLLARELLNPPSVIRVQIGVPILSDDAMFTESPPAIARELRRRTLSVKR